MRPFTIPEGCSSKFHLPPFHLASLWCQSDGNEAFTSSKETFADRSPQKAKRAMEAPRGVAMGRKRALDDDDERRDSPRASSESENISPRLLDAQVGLPTPIGGHVGIAGAGSERGRVTGAVKSRRLSQDLGETPAQFVAKITALSGPASPALRVFMSDAEAARTPTAFVGSPFELNKAAGRLSRPMFPLGAQAQGRPVIPTPLGTPGRVPEQKTSPPGQLRRLDGGIAARTGGPGSLSHGEPGAEEPCTARQAYEARAHESGQRGSPTRRSRTTHGNDGNIYSIIGELLGAHGCHVTV